MQLVGEAGDGMTAVEVAAHARPDVVITELCLPALDGTELTRRLRTGRNGDEAPHVIILTTHDLDRHVFATLHAGASGFLLKNTPPADLLSAVRAVTAGAAVIAPTVTRRVVDRLLATCAPVRPSTLDALTAREQEILDLVAQGLSNADIAAELFMSIGTVKAHVSRILTKLDLRDRVQAVVFAHRAGLAGPPPI